MNNMKSGFFLWMAKSAFTAVVCMVVVGLSASLSAANQYSANGTYTYTVGTLVMTWANSDFICDGPDFPAMTQPVTSISTTEMLWPPTNPADNSMTWTRPSGTDGDITGTWSLSDPSGNSYIATFSGGTVSVSATITQCNINGTPTISSFSPTSGVAGNLVTINGSNGSNGNDFSPILANNVVMFNGVPAVVTGVRQNQLFALVPTGATTGTISVTNSGGTATSGSLFTVSPGTTAVTLAWGGVNHRYNSDDIEFDAFDVGITSYATSLAGMTLSVAGPNFSYTFTDADLIQYINGQMAVVKKYLPPDTPLAPGVYTFTLDDGKGHISHRVDTHITVTSPLPQVDSTTIQLQRKADGSYRISWAPVNATKTYYYRVRINRNDTAETSIYDGPRAMTTFADVAAGILFDNSMYKVRVEVVDSPNNDLATNRSLSAWKFFRPQVGDYVANRLIFYYLMANNRIEKDGVKYVNFGFGVCTTTGVCDAAAATTAGNAFATAMKNATASAVLTGPSGFTYTFKPADHSGSDFTLLLPLPANAPTGNYKFQIINSGVSNDGYATLTTAVDYPIPTLAYYQAENLDNLPTGYIRFSWADVDHTGALYYRVQIQDSGSVPKQFFTSARLNQTYIDMPKATLGDLTNKTWRVEVYDSPNANTQRNRVNGPWTVDSLASLPAYVVSKPVIDFYFLYNMNFIDVSTAALYLLGASDSDGNITQRQIVDPNRVTHNLTSPDSTFQGAYSLIETGSPAVGLYTLTTTDSAANTAVRFNFQPAPLPIPAVDYHTFQVDLESNGTPRISWAPVVSNVPIWYYLEIWNVDTMTPVVIPAGNTASTTMQQASVTVPSQYMQGQVMFRIYALDGSDYSTVNNASLSVMVGYQPGLNYAGLADADIDGYASNIDPNDNSQGVTPFNPGGIVGIPGDCDGSGGVTIAEVQSAINMFLGIKTVAICVDTGGDNLVSIAEVQKVINGFLGL